MSKIQVNEIVNHFDTGAPDCPKGLTVTGFSTFTGSASFSGDVSIGGTLTYEDVTNIDSVGIITAQSGVHYGTVGSGVTIDAVGAGTSLGFLVNGSERVRIDSSGRLLVGTSSTPPANTADVFIKGGTGSGGAGGLTITRTNSTPADNNSLGNIYFSDSNGTPAGWIHSQRDGGTWTSGSSQPSRLVFATTADGASSPTERMRIDKDGHVLVGNSAITNKGTLNAYSNDSTPGLRCVAGSSMGLGSAILAVDKHANVNTTSQVFMVFTINVQNTGSGQINANGASQAAFGSFSDRRLKENIVDIPSQLENICRLRPVEFDYIESEGGGHQTSFIAQEFEEVYPDAIGEREDGMKTLTGWGKTEAILVKAFQEAVEKINALEARLSALEGGAS